MAQATVVDSVQDTARATIPTDAATALKAASDQSFQELRSRVISHLVKLNHALDKNQNDLSQALLSRFCDTLVDYLSAGHFQVFQRIVPSADEYAAIESTTDIAMTFNDDFGNLQSINIERVKAALERLALVLGTRFELEDNLLADRH
jgi:regulator of sigma D